MNIYKQLLIGFLIGLGVLPAIWCKLMNDAITWLEEDI